MTRSNSQPVIEVSRYPIFLRKGRSRHSYKVGYINKGGSIIVDPMFDDGRPFSQGLAAIEAGRKWGYIDSLGNLAIPPQFDGHVYFSEGLAVVRIGKLNACIDTAGSPLCQHD